MPAVVEFDLRDVSKGLQKINSAGRNFGPVWRELRGPMRKDQRDHVRQQKASSGASWKPLAPATREKRVRSLTGVRKNYTKKGKLRKPVQKRIDRVLSGKVLSKAETRIRPGSLEFRQSRDFARVHQTGGRVGNGARVPAREFLWVSDSLLRLAVDRMEEHLTKAWARK